MKNIILNSVKSWGFSSGVFTSVVTFYPDYSQSRSVFTILFAIVGVVVVSLFVGFAAEAFIDQIKKINEEWNGTGSRKRTPH